MALGIPAGGAPHAPRRAAAPGSAAAAELKRALLELRPEEARRARVGELLRRAHEGDASECAALVLDHLVNFPSSQGLGLHALRELLASNPHSLLGRLGPQRVYDLFSPRGDDGPPAGFLHGFLRWKELQGLSTHEECEKLQKLLMRRAKEKDLRKVPASQGRAWLCRIWLDVPSSRPSRELVAGCCARWMADARSPLADKLPCLSLMREEMEQRSRLEGHAWLIGHLLEQVCRSPVDHSPDLQHLLWLLGGAPSPQLLRPLLEGLAQELERLASLWVILCLWVPEPQPPLQDGALPPWPADAPAPPHALLCAVLGAFWQLAAASAGDAAAASLCRTSLLTLCAMAAWGVGRVAQGAAELLLALHRRGPRLPEEVWESARPVVEQQLAGLFAAAGELAGRLRAGVASGGGGCGHPAAGAFHSAPALQAGFRPAAAAPPATAPSLAPAAPFGGPPPAAAGAGRFHSAPGGAGGCGFQALPEDSEELPYDPAHVGLQNTNNTCYMNSFIQALFMTNRFIWRIFSFKLRLKKNPSKVDKEDFQFGRKLVEVLQEQMAKMALTKHKHTDIWELLQAFPDIYRSGEQQDVTETIRFVFDQLGGFEQALIREVFAGELAEKTQCQVCGHVKSRPETFSDLVLTVPPEEEAKAWGTIPTTQMLLDERLKFERLDDDALLECETCQKKQPVGKWAEIVSPPAHLCICLNRFTFNMKTCDFTKEKTPIRVDGGVQIGQFRYELYFVIFHSGQTATSGHYYAMGRRSEPTASQDNPWMTMDDSQVKPADMALLSGEQQEKKKDDNPYVLFYRCAEAPPTPVARMPRALANEVKRKDNDRQES